MENDEQNRKIGLIPEEEIRGSDADAAYDNQGNFEHPSGSGTWEEDHQEHSDAEPDKEK